MIYKRQNGVPEFESIELYKKNKEYVVLIPVINEGEKIRLELMRAKKNNIFDYADIVICDGGSSDNSVDKDEMYRLKVNSILIKKDTGRQGAQIRMGMYWAFERKYKGIITIDGNNKDSIEDVPRFIEKLKQGYDFVQGSRFVKGGVAINTPLIRLFAVKCIHAPIISMTAHYRYTDTTNAYRGYSMKYLRDSRVQPLRDVFVTYELLAYLSVRANQIGMKTCEIPVKRKYPSKGQIPTKISFFKGNYELIKILIKNAMGKYNPICSN